MKYVTLWSIVPILAVLSCSIAKAQGEPHPNRFSWPEEGSTLIGEFQTMHIQRGDTLLEIAEQYGLGYTDIRAANDGVDPLRLQIGSTLKLPTQYLLPDTEWRGIVINLAEYRLYYFLPEKGIIYTYPIAIGQGNTPTPQGDMHITARIPNPTWYPPESIRQLWAEQGKEVRRQIPAGPDNPLGPFAINLSTRGYLIHGTNQRFGIGTQTSAGCIRMNNADIEQLVQTTRIGVQVRIIDEPIKMGIHRHQVLLEAHTPVYAEGKFQQRTDLIHALSEFSLNNGINLSDINWQAVATVLDEKNGIASEVSTYN